MKTPQQGEVYLKPGELVWGQSDLRIRTVLGSCVAICLWHPLRRCGGMAHVMLPERTRPGPSLDGRYADEALAILLNEMRQGGARPQEYIAKLFGGASVLAGMYGRPNVVDVGARNVERSLALLRSHGLSLRASDVGGQIYRRLYFELSSGDVWLKRLPLLSPGGVKP